MDLDNVCTNCHELKEEIVRLKAANAELKNSVDELVEHVQRVKLRLMAEVAANHDEICGRV